MQIFCIRFVVFGTNTCFANCSLFCFVAMHTIEKQCVARQLQSKFQLLHLPCCFVCLRLFLAQKSILHIFCFYVNAQYTNRKPCVSKVMQSKFQHIAIKILTLVFILFFVCLSLFFWHKNVFCKLFFLFGCHAVAANCAFARYRQTFVAFITSARYCIGILRFSHCIFVVLQNNKSDFCICFCLLPFNGKKLRL